MFEPPPFYKALTDAGGKLFAVGGMVRDALLGQSEKPDEDYLVTGLPAKDLANILKPLAYVNPVGKHFGVLKIKLRDDKEREIDIALPRKEISTGSGHKDFEVDFDPDLPVEVDLKRRDFTINALAYDFAGQKLVDPFGGEKDLQARLLRQVFDRAFEEDPLRMFRAVQFLARFELSLEKETKDAIFQQAHLSTTVSAERVLYEFEKLFSRANKPSLGLHMLKDTGLWQAYVPEPFLPGKPFALEAFDFALVDKLPRCPALRFGGLFRWALGGVQPRPERDALFAFQKSAAAKFSLSNDYMATICAAVFDSFGFDHTATDLELRREIFRVTPAMTYPLVAIDQAEKGVNDQGFYKRLGALLELPIYRPKDLALGGEDLMAMGVEKGPKLGEILSHLVGFVIDDPNRNTKDVLAEEAKRLLEEGA